MSSSFAKSDDVIKILLATDIHLGYEEKDKIRGNDSFNTFEEILQIAEKKDVDFILLGGDLFHDSRPSPSCIFRCTSLLRKYCLGDKPVSLEFVSDQSLNFKHCQTPIVNYEDPNQNISIPVFSIHGNHDDPVGVNQLSTLDIFSTMGLINYFGKITNLQEIELEPLLIQKGLTKMELFGLSHVKDERLSRLMMNGKVSMAHPHGDLSEWFSMLVLHQNRVDRGPKNFIPESFLPEFLDFVLWGHEHDCRITPEVSAEKQIPISQPGSSVATSLAKGEAGEKYIGLLQVYKKTYDLTKIKLETVRPFIFDDMLLCDYEFNKYSMKKIHEQAEKFVKDKIREMIAESKSLLTGHVKQPKLPLIRLRVEYDDEDQLFNVVRAGQSFEDQVANPLDLITTNKKFRQHRNTTDIDEEIMEQQARQLRVETVVESYFKNAELAEHKKLSVLCVKGICQAVISFIDKSDTSAIEEIVNHQTKKTLDKLIQADVDMNSVNDELIKLREQRNLKEAEEEEETRRLLDDPARRSKRQYDHEEENEEEPEEDAVTVISDDGSDDSYLSPVRGRGRGNRRARGEYSRARGRRARGGSSTAHATTSRATPNTNTKMKQAESRFIFNISDSD